MNQIGSFTFVGLGLGMGMALALAPWASWASLEAISSENHESVPTVTTIPHPNAQSFSRAQAVLQHFGVPSEADPTPQLADFELAQTEAGYAGLLPWVDPTHSLDKLTDLGGGRLDVFQDSGFKRQPDFSVRMAADAGEADRHQPAFHGRLMRAAHQNPASQPLKGLRIALDAGHMGSDLWDARTGKYVRDRRTGRKLSEGVMALQVALLLEPELTRLGAQVMLTRRDFEPVSKLRYEDLDLHEQGLIELREGILDDWFLDLLKVAPPGPALYHAFSSSPKFHKLFSESMRWHYYFLREDLDARARKIQAWSPDLTLVIHFDTSDPPGDPNGLNPRHYNGTKSYIPGTVQPQELVSREDRMFTVWHLLDPISMQASLNLGRFITHQIRDDLGIPLDGQNGGGNADTVEPGIFARNLQISRRTHSMALAYVECMYYNDPVEFNRLGRQDHAMTIGGATTHYSDRLVQVMQALRDGTVKFVRRYPSGS